ncbi:MAG: slipin family protein [Methanomicrobiaceae archaeon]|nr:slipin family protein [Methanomicrobiaceae archaeon]
MTKKQHPLPYLLFFLIAIPAASGLWFGHSGGNLPLLGAGIVLLLIALTAASSTKVADQWEKAVVLRVGRFRALAGPGFFTIIPLVDTIAYWIDLRIITTSFTAEKTLTKDTVPVDVEAVLFWKVTDPKKAALEVENYRSAISWAAQTALREVIGKSNLADMLEGREKLDAELQKIIDQRTEQWGIHISSVEIRDILIPTELQDAMSMQAQAERERQARVILGESEKQVAAQFEEAARTYEHNPTALHLRAMNMLYECLRENATLVLVPSSVLDTMSLGDISGVTALSKGLADQMRRAREEAPAHRYRTERSDDTGGEKKPPA